MDLLRRPGIQALIDLSIDEDLIFGDISSELTVPENQENTGTISTKQSCVIAGQEIAAAIFHRIDTNLQVDILVRDGTQVETGRSIMRISGNTRSLLAGERLALNFLQRLSGIATLARSVSDSIESTGCKVVDTRKTTPGWRILEKYAVLMGGCRNHRFSLGDGILIKDNHIIAAGGITQAVKAARQRRRHPLMVEIEVKSMEEAQEAVAAGADALLLDNMTPEMLREIASRFKESVTLEASGNITPESVRNYAETGVHLLSMGALTHSAPAVDLSLNLE